MCVLTYVKYKLNEYSSSGSIKRPSKSCKVKLMAQFWVLEVKILFQKVASSDFLTRTSVFSSPSGLATQPEEKNFIKSSLSSFIDINFPIEGKEGR